VAVVAAFIVVIILVEQLGGLHQDASVTPAPASLVSALTSVPRGHLEEVKGGSINNPPIKIPASYKPTLFTANGLPQVVFVGGEYCPLCALERWSLVVGLSHFGKFSNLKLIRSSVYDSPANVPTFTFAHGASYKSSYISFLPREHQSNVSIGGNGPPYAIFQSLPPKVLDAFTTLGGGAYPFLDYGGRYASVGSEAADSDVAALSGLSWDQVLSQLRNPKSTIAQEILGGANYITATTCLLTSNRPGSACGSSMIRGLESQISSSQ
ncbi:MAG: DUF929 family protein, partial [Candidatus Dormibacteria bacterium]